MVIERRRPQTTKEALVQIYDILAGMEGSITHICANCDKQEKRISTIESWQNRLIGGVSVVAVGAGYLLARMLPGIGKQG